MSNITITNNELNNVLLNEGKFDDAQLTFAEGTSLIAEGTILALDSVSLNYVPFVKGGTTNEDGIPKAILTYDVTVESAGTYPVRILIGGDVRQDRLIIQADGDNSNVDAAVLAQLRDYAIIPIANDQLNILDNQ
jgi:hypothetical protein